MNEHEKLIEIIVSALECFQKELPSYGRIQTFPRNYCEEVSSILLSILEEEEYSNFKMMRGTNTDDAHHFWLESENSIIDLTAHQFDDINEPFKLIDKSVYPLNKEFSINIHTKSIDTGWSHLMSLIPTIKKKFYSEYYKK
jgi:hypothetical protein